METRYGFCRCGCGLKTTIAAKTNTARGVKKGEPNNFISGHGRTRPMLERLADRFVVKDRGFSTPCWVWTGLQTTTGYGRAPDGGKAHRRMYEAVVGPIPEGLSLDHLCRVTLCVNPDHLEPVTHVENMRRSANVRLTARDVAEIRSLPELGRAELGAMFNVSPNTISSIRAYQCWKEVEPLVRPQERQAA